MALYDFLSPSRVGQGQGPTTRSAPASPQAQPTIQGLGTDLVYEGQRQGFFDPKGSPYIRAMLRREALRNYRNRLRRGGVFGRSLGLDPMQQRQQLLSTELEGGNELSDFLGRGQSEELFSNRDFIRQLLGGETGFQRQRQLAKEEADRQKGSLGGTIGSLVGTAAGSFAGGAGTAYGGALGKKLGGG